MWSVVRLLRMEVFLIFFITVMMVSLMMVADFFLFVTSRTYLMSYMSWLSFLLILLFVNIMIMVMYVFRAERKYIFESEIYFRNAMEYFVIGMALVGIEG